MRVRLSTHGSRGDVEPMVGLTVRLRALGAEVRVCAPPDFAELWPVSVRRWCRLANERAPYRLYRATATDHWVLDPDGHPDHR